MERPEASSPDHGITDKVEEDNDRHDGNSKVCRNENSNEAKQESGCTTASEARAEPKDSAVSIDQMTPEMAPPTMDDSATNSETAEAVQQTMALNVAYEALEQVRQANICVEFGKEVPVQQCIPCLRLPPPPVRGFGLRQKLQHQGHFRAAQACLTCGYPVCTQHRCPDFWRENVVICNDCVPFFSLDFVAEAAEQSPAERRQSMNHMLDVYDRAWLILKYSAQFMDEISKTLEEGSKSKDKFSLGSSATGFVGGLVGVAGALTIWTPAGVPQLLASVVFGSAGAATSAGSEAMFNRSSANKAADTIITVHGMLQSLARLSQQYVLEQAAAAKYASADEIVSDVDETAKSQESSVSQEEQQKLERLQRNSDIKNSNRKNWARATGAVFRPLTMGVLSAASVVMEAREMKTTVDKIKNGSPCSKASNVKLIAQEVDSFPTTDLLAKECAHYFQ